MKQKLSLLEVCKLPDVQLHSKTSFFKSIVSRQSNQVLDMKQQIAKLSYTVKIIGVQGQQVGITSKRVPLQYKKKQTSFARNNYVGVDNYLPHKSFYSHALAPIHVEKQPRIQLDKELVLQINSNNTIRVDEGETRSNALRSRARSMANFRSTKKFKKAEENIDQIGQIQGKRGDTNIKKKSFSSLLKQCNNFAPQKMNPLQHEQNALFKKIKKIKQGYSQRGDAIMFNKYEPQSRQSYASSQHSLRYYKEGAP